MQETCNIIIQLQCHHDDEQSLFFTFSFGTNQAKQYAALISGCSNALIRCCWSSDKFTHHWEILNYYIECHKVQLDYIWVASVLPCARHVCCEAKKQMHTILCPDLVRTKADFAWSCVPQWQLVQAQWTVLLQLQPFCLHIAQDVGLDQPRHQWWSWCYSCT